MSDARRVHGCAVAVAVAAFVSGLAGCADVPDPAADDPRPVRSIAHLVDEPVYVQLDGVGDTPDGTYRPSDEERYLVLLTDELRASGLFPAAVVWTDAAPDGALIVDAHIDAEIDLERSWTHAAWLMIVPVRTRGRVEVTFEVKRADRVFETGRYSETAETFAIPAAEFAGHTWIAKSGVLATLVQRFVADLQTDLVWRARAMERVAVR